MINPIAAMMIVSGVLLLALGISLARKHRKIAGTTISFLGLVAMAVPFVVSYMMPNP